MISKIIHQIYWNRLYENDFHYKVKNIRKKMKLLNPDYKFIIYNEYDIDNIIKTNFKGKILFAYQQINLLVPKSDLARLLILYLYGGIYLDMKSTIECKLSDFITEKDTAIVSVEREGWSENFCQWGLIFEKSHPLLKIAIDDIVNNIINIKYYNDIENMTTQAFGKSVVKFHKKYFNNVLKIHTNKNKYKIKNKELIFENHKIRYRIYGIEYNNVLSYNKYNLNDYLYKNNTLHWRIEQRQRNVLKGFFLTNYCKFLKTNYQYFINKNNILSLILLCFILYRNKIK